MSEWQDYFLDRGVSHELAVSYLAYIETLEQKKQPIIFELDHLSLLLGINIEYLAKMIASPSHFYRTFDIPKRSGGIRKISAPYESLLSCQRWILKNILNKIVLHPSAHGFISGRSIKTNAESHLLATSLLKMDLRDFFPSIPQGWVINIFEDIGYLPNVAFYLSSLCCYDGHLAQGAATSPALSNIVLRGLDNRLSRLANKCSLVYTRYADDITFSGKDIHPSFSKLVEKIVLEYGLKVNSEKTRLKITDGTKIITGLSIVNQTIAVPRKFKRELKNEIFFIKKFGLLSHLANRKIRNPNYLNILLGKVAFWLYIEPADKNAQDAKKLILRLMQI